MATENNSSLIILNIENLQWMKANHDVSLKYLQIYFPLKGMFLQSSKSIYFIQDIKQVLSSFQLHN